MRCVDIGRKAFLGGLGRPNVDEKHHPDRGRTMKKMQLGIYLLLLSIWCLIFGISDDFALLCYISLFLMLSSIVSFFLGYRR